MVCKSDNNLIIRQVLVALFVSFRPLSHARIHGMEGVDNCIKSIPRKSSKKEMEWRNPRQIGMFETHSIKVRAPQNLVLRRCSI